MYMKQKTESSWTVNNNHAEFENQKPVDPKCSKHLVLFSMTFHDLALH